MPPRRVLRPRGNCPEEPETCSDDQINRLLRDRNLVGRIRRRLEAERRRRLAEVRALPDLPSRRRQLNVGQPQDQADDDFDNGGAGAGAAMADAGDDNIEMVAPYSFLNDPIYQRISRGVEREINSVVENQRRIARGREEVRRN